MLRGGLQVCERPRLGFDTGEQGLHGGPTRQPLIRRVNIALNRLTQAIQLLVQFMEVGRKRLALRGLGLRLNSGERLVISIDL